MTAGRPALALCASNATGDRAFSCALATAAGIHAVHADASHRSDPLAACAALCAQHGVGPGELRELRLDLGPGSYTGLRIAVTFARFLGAFGALELRATDTLALLAHQLGPVARRLRPVLDARAGHLHDGCLHWQAGKLVHALPMRAVPRATWLESLAATDLVVAPPTLGAELSAAIAARGAALQVARALDATALFSDELPFAAAAHSALVPHYLLPSYAELRAP